MGTYGSDGNYIEIIETYINHQGNELYAFSIDISTDHDNFVGSSIIYTLTGDL